MERIYVKNIRKIIKNKKEIQDKLNVKLDIKKNYVEISGKKIDEYIATKIFEAIDLGFSVPQALILTDENYMFEKINIKELSHKNPRVVRGRIIGTHRKTLDTIEKISNCKLVLHDNILGIIGNTEDMHSTIQAVYSLIRGSKQSNVYKYLEKQRKRNKLIFL